jgi:riboflavin synthase
MFTGIVEDLGVVEAVEPFGDFARVHFGSAVVTSDARIGDSICVNGVCLTVTQLLGDPPRGFTADVMGETLARSSLKGIAPGTKVNLERSVRLADRLGGHLVQGHVDGTATIVGRDPQFSPGGATPRTPRETSDRGAIAADVPDWEVVRISLPADLNRYVVHKGSIAVDGISLTVSAIGADWFEVSLIPETLRRTTLGTKQPGADVNLEVDVIAKYVEKLTGGAR